MKVKFNLILEKFENYLKYKNYCIRTIEIYKYYTNEFLNIVDKTPSHITYNDIEDYLLKYNYSSTSKQNQVISAVKLFSRSMLKMRITKIHCERPRKKQQLPEILSRNEILLVIKSIDNLKHRAIISFIYGCGLRISECINAKISDINGKEQLLKIVQGKGKKDRYVPINYDLLNLLREYYKRYKPVNWLFMGQNGEQYSTTSIRKILDRAVLKAGISRNIKVHYLRHSYATHLLENGVDLSYIQDILGHKKPETTRIYTQVRKSHFKNLNLVSIN